MTDTPRDLIARRLEEAAKWLSGDYELTAGEPTIPVLRSTVAHYVRTMREAAALLRAEAERTTPNK